MDYLKQQVAIKFCKQWEKLVTEIQQMLQTLYAEQQYLSSSCMCGISG
jgi:hypothetical protein